MEAWFEDSIRQLSESPVLQGILAAVCTFILEDPTLLTCALLVADQQMLYTTALIGLSLGIGLGDWGLYALGRFLGPKTVSWGLVSKGRLEKASKWFERNLIAAVFISRFVPGLRLPTNVAAGMVHAAPVRYLPSALVASLVWTFVMLSAISKLGEAFLPYLGALKWPVGIALIIGLVLMQRNSIKHFDEEVEGIVKEGGETASYFEFWHPIFFYLPVAGYYAWLSMKYRSLTLPTVANPSIYSGGLIRESKCAILDMVPESLKKWFAPHILVLIEDHESNVETTQNTLESLAQAGISLPIVAKPDEGQRGLGVRPIYTEKELSLYLEQFPKNVPMCVQEMVPYQEEVGILYYRLPSEEKGHILSITQKEFPIVHGDGEHTLRELILRDARASMMKQVFFARHENELDRVLGVGEEFQLVFAGNHKQGCIFRDGMHLLTPELEKVVDSISKEIPGFYFGRYDLRFKDAESLGRGTDFQIVELNGAGAEATHIWDPDAELSEAYSVLFEQFDILFKIGHENRRQGFTPMGARSLLKDVAEYHRVARNYPLAH
jgi:membrane protein DedA with SNARE-associated domain